MIADENPYQKFLDQDPEKRERILNAAMKEFLQGFKNASTDNIVREAGISKGLLFHYFGTKENLYNFLIDHTVEIVQAEYVDLINIRQKDILDSIWQLSLLKQDLSIRFPTIFEFLARVYIDDRDCPAKKHLERFTAIHGKIMQDMYGHADVTLFKDDVEPEQAIKIIRWVMKGLTESMTAAMEKDFTGSISREQYDKMLGELKDYLSIMRRCFYKNKEDLS